MSKQLELLAAADDLTAVELTAEAAIQWDDLEAAGDDGKPKVPKFTMTAYTGGAMQVGGFFHPVVVDLAGVKASSKTIPIFRGHDPDKIVGHGEPAIGANDISANGVISADNEHSREVVSLSRNNFPWQASIGASVLDREFVREGESVTVNGKLVKGPVLVVRKSQLNEISFVPLGADRRTSAKVAAKSAGTGEKTMTITKDTTFAEWVAAQDCEVEGLSEKVRAKLEAQFKAEKAAAVGEPEDSPHGRDFLATLSSAKQEKERIDSISAIAADAIKKYPTQLDEIERLVKAAHNDKKCEPKDFKLGLLETLMPVGPSPHRQTTADNEVGTQAMEAAICKTLRMRNIEKHFPERVLDAADKCFRHGIGLQQLLFKSAGAHGQHFDSASNTKALLKAAFIEASGFSTYSLPGILSNVMNKLLLDYFNAVDQAWRQIAAIGSVRDFKQRESYTLTGTGVYEKLGPAGEINHGSLGEVKYTNQADTYAGMLAITRQDIINDDLGALQRVPQRLGREAALKINDVFWTKFLDNSSFFSSGNSNVSTGGGSALGTADGAAINAAEVIFMKQTDPGGKPLGVRPSILLAPPTLLNTAARWMGGQLIVTGSDTTLPNVNVYQGRYRVVSSPYMENTTYTGNSSAAWYLLADPMDLPVIEVVFLNGRDVPFVESADADFDTLGIQVRSYHDFGCELQEYRGGVRSAGS